MRGKPAFMSSRAWVPWSRKRVIAIRLAACFLLVTLATAAVRFAPQANQLIWVANGVLLTFLFLAPRRSWAAYLAIGFAAQMAGSILVSPEWQMNLLLAVLNLIEVLISALLLRRRSNALPRFTDRAYLIRFIAFGILAGPLAAGLIYAPITALWLHTAPVSALLQWAAADGLGTAVTTLACVAIFRTRFKNSSSFRKNWGYLPLVVVASIAVFSQTRAPLPFLLYPLLLLVLLRLGMGWAAVATLFAAAVGNWCTALGEGPFASSNSLTQHEPFILLQVFIASAMFTLYSISAVLESLRSAERRLQEVVLQHALVTENSRDAIILADFNNHRTYVSAAVQRIVGWTTEEFAKLKTLDLVHPEDRPKAEAVAHELHSGAEDAMIECRVRKRNGEYIWVEASLRVVRDAKTGAASKLLNIVRDMTERKHAEQKLQEAYNAVEALAVTDGLTGLANRRRFDQGLASEWRRGLRDRKPLSLLMIDADLFKSYNDTYGHPRGDNCLKQIAESALDVVARPGDLVARFGGEEFAVILPNTGSEGAVLVANEICDALRSRRLPHRSNPYGIMTVSVGCATMVPSFGLHSVNLVELADAALYQAKRYGRNQVCDSNAMNAGGNGSL